MRCDTQVYFVTDGEKVLVTDPASPGKFGTQTAKQSAEYQKYIALALSKSIDAFLLEYTRDNALK